MRNLWLLISVLWLWTCSGGGGSSPTEPQEPAPVSNFTATPTSLNQGQSVAFTSTSTGTITSYAWNVDADPEIEGATSTYTHTYSDVGTYSVVLTVTGPGGSNSKTVADMIIVSSAAPTPTSVTTQTTQEDESITISLTATDPNGQAVTFAITSDPTNGTATLSGTEITYTPNANFYGTDSFDYTASNGTYTSDPVTITITVEGEDDGNPTTNDVSATTDEDTVVTVNLDATEIDGDNYSFSIISQPSNGTLGSINGNQVEYTPNQDWNGTDTFTFEATDDRTYRRNVATATIIVNAVNDAPVANDITSQVTDENRAMQLDITLDATDVEGDALTYSIIGTNNGTVTVNGSTATYTPNQDWNGEDTFTYKANDGNLDSNTATVTVTVNAVNDAPETEDQSASTNEDTAVTITLSVVDVDTQQGMTRSIVSSPSNGSVVLSGSGNQTATYTPTTNWNGTDTFTWKANDGELDSNVSTVTITVAAVNDAPTTEDVSTTIDENRTASRSTGITLQGSDVDGDNLTYTVVSGPSNGNASIAGSILTYAANQDWNGTETITYKANDGTVDSNVSTVTITVAAVNDAPVTQNVSFTTDEDTPYTESYTAYVSDVEGDNLTITTVTNPTNGTATCDDATNCTYTPNQDFNGTDSFTYKVNDGELDSNVSTVTVTVTAVNDAPVANDMTATMDENKIAGRYQPVTIFLNATDVDGDDLTYSVVGDVSNGTLGSINGNQIIYTPTQDYNGEDTFTYKANDGNLDSNTATVSITINSVNDAPVTTDQTASTNEDTAVDITLTSSDVESDTITFSIVSDVSNGTTTLSGATVTYTPSANFNGTDTFTFKANDGTDDSNTSTVTITVAAVNDAPVTSDQTASTDEDTAVDITLSSTDVEGDSVTYSIVSDVSNGSTSLSGSTVTYTPTADWNGTDTFTFKANDGTDDGNTSTVTITVAAVNDAPVAIAVNSPTNEDTAKFITLSATDVEGSSLTYSIVSNPSNGSLGNVNGSTVFYTPNTNWNGTDTFTYKANDGSLDSNTATVTVTVNPVNDAPVASAVSASTNEDTAKAITLSATDTEGGSLTYNIVSSPPNGSLGSVSGTGVTYTPSANFNGTDTFTYKATDGTGEDSNTATVTVTVAAVNDAPVTSDQTASTDEDTALDITLSSTDVEGDSVTYSIVSDVSNGSTSLSGSTVTYTPTANYNGTDTFTFKANDGTDDSNTSTVTITVAAVNDAPTLDDITFTVQKNNNGQNLNGNYSIGPLSSSYSDVDGDSATSQRILDASNLSGFDQQTNTSPLIHISGNDYAEFQGDIANEGNMGTFTFTVADGTVDSNEATATIIINPNTAPPIPNDASGSMDEDSGTLTLNLSSSADAEGDDLVFSNAYRGSGSGLFTISGTTITYSPDTNWSGTATFGYRSFDGLDYSCGDGSTSSTSPCPADEVGTITVTVNAVNDVPTTINQSSTVGSGSSRLDISGYSDVETPDLFDGTSGLTFSVVSGVSNGTLGNFGEGVASNGAALKGNQILYQPNVGFTGTDTFTYKVNDGTDDSNTSTFTITVQ